MKKVAAILVMTFVSTAALANLKAPGTVVRSLCSTTVSTSSPVFKEIPKNVCLATIVGRDGSFLVTDSKVWSVGAADEGKSLSELQLVGSVGPGSQFKPLLQKILIRAQAKIDGEGEATTVLFLQNRSNTFRAVNFRIMFHTLGLKY